MELLHTPLVCIVLQYSIEDMCIVDYILSAFTEISRSIPLSVKEVLKLCTIPSASMTLKYLEVLWYNGDSECKYIMAASFGLIEMLSYYGDPSGHMLSCALRVAAEHNHINVLEHLLDMDPEMDVSSALLEASRKGDKVLVNWLLPRTHMSDSYGTANFVNSLMRNAIKFEHVDVLEQLFHIKCNISILTRTGIRAYVVNQLLARAIEWNKPDAIKELERLIEEI